MSKDSRAEFEDWFCGTIPYKIARESWFAIMDDGDYIITDVQAAWAGWKASRAALSVELPDVIGQPLAYHEAINDVKDALDDAGVDYK